MLWNSLKEKLLYYVKMMDPQIPEVEDVPSLLLPCASCSRTFRPEALSKHSKVCEKTLMKKRKQFDSAKQRLQGTEIENFAIQPIIKNPRKKEPHLNPSKAKIKEKIDLAKTIQIAKKSLDSPPCISQVKPSEHEECPHCGRSFGPKASERHREFCKEQHQKLKLTPTINNEAKERLKVRTSYRGPLTNKVLNRDRYQPNRNRDPSPMTSSLTELPDEGGKSKGLMRNASLRSSLRSRPTESVAPPPLRRTMTQINPSRSVRGSRDNVNERDEKSVENNSQNRSTTSRPRLYSRESTERNSIICDVQSGSHRKKISDFTSAQSSPNKKFSLSGKSPLDLNDTSVNKLKELNVTSANIKKMPIKQLPNKLQITNRSKLPIFQRNKLNNVTNISSSKREPVSSSDGKNFVECLSTSFHDFTGNISSNCNNGKVTTLKIEEHPIEEKSLHLEYMCNSLNSPCDIQHLNEIENPCDSNSRNSNINELWRNDSDSSVISLSQSVGQTYDSTEIKSPCPKVDGHGETSDNEPSGDVLFPGQLFSPELSTTESLNNGHSLECTCFSKECQVCNNVILSSHGDSLQLMPNNATSENSSSCSLHNLADEFTMKDSSAAKLMPDSSIETNRDCIFEENFINEPCKGDSFQLFGIDNSISQASSSNDKISETSLNKFHCQQISISNLNDILISQFKDGSVLESSSKVGVIITQSSLDANSDIANESFSKNILGCNSEICDNEPNSCVVNEERNKTLSVDIGSDQKKICNAVMQHENKIYFENFKSPETKMCSKYSNSFLKILEHNCNNQMQGFIFIPGNLDEDETQNINISDPGTNESPASLDKNELDFILSGIESTLTNEKCRDLINEPVSDYISTKLQNEAENKTYPEDFTSLGSNKFTNNFSSSDLCETDIATSSHSDVPAGTDSGVLRSGETIHSYKTFESQHINTAPALNKDNCKKIIDPEEIPFHLLIKNPSEKHSDNNNALPDLKITEKYCHEDQLILKKSCLMNESKILDCITVSAKNIEDHIHCISKSTCILPAPQSQALPEVIKNDKEDVKAPAFEFPEKNPPIDKASDSQYLFFSETDASRIHTMYASNELPLKESINNSVETFKINSIPGNLVDSENIGMNSSIVSSSSRICPLNVEEESQHKGWTNNVQQSINNVIVEFFNEPLSLPENSKSPIEHTFISNAQPVLMRNIQCENTFISYPLLETETTIAGERVCIMGQHGNYDLTDVFSHSAVTSLWHQNYSLNYLNLIIGNDNLHLKNNLCPKLIFKNCISPRCLTGSTKQESSLVLNTNDLKTTTLALPQKTQNVEIKNRPKTAPADFNASTSNVSLLLHNEHNFSETNSDLPYSSAEYCNNLLTALPLTNHLLEMAEELKGTNYQSNLQQNKSKYLNLAPTFSESFCATLDVHENSSTLQQNISCEPLNAILTVRESNSQNRILTPEGYNSSVHSLPAFKLDEEVLVRCSSVLFESDRAENRDGETLSQPWNSTISSLKTIVPNTNVSWFVGFGNLDTMNGMPVDSGRLEKSNKFVSYPSNFNNSNRHYFDFKLRQSCLALDDDPVSALLNKNVFPEDKVVYETCADNQLNSQKIYSNRDQLVTSNTNTFINNAEPGKYVLESTCSQAEENYGTHICNDVWENEENNSITWQDIANSNSSSHNDHFGTLDTITEDSLEATNCECEDRDCNKIYCYPEFDQTHVMFWNDRQPYSYNGSNNNYQKQRTKDRLKDMKCKGRTCGGFLAEDFVTGCGEEMERDSLDSSSGDSVLDSHQCRWHSSYNFNPTDRVQDHCRLPKAGITHPQHDYNNKNKYPFTPHERNTTHSRRLPPIIIYKKVSKQVKKIYENTNDPPYPSEYIKKKKIFNKSMKDADALGRNFVTDKESNFDSVWEFSDSSDDTDKESSTIFCKQSYESLEYNENEERNDCHTIKTSLYELPFCHKKMEPSIKLPPLQLPKMPKPSLVGRKSYEVEKLPPLGKTKSDAEKYNPYLSAERQMLELFGGDDTKPRPILPEIPGSSPIQSSPSSAFVKYSSPKRSSSAESVKCDNKENNENSIIIDTSLEEKVENRRNFSLSNLSLCSVVSIDSIDCNKNSVNSALLGGHLDDFQRSFSTLEPKTGRTHSKTKVNLQEMLYGSQSPEHASHSESSNSDAGNLEACEAELLISMLEFEKMLKGSPDPSPQPSPPLCSSSVAGDTPKTSPRNNTLTLEKNQRNLNNSIDSAYSSLTRSSGAEGERESGKPSELPKFCHECGSKYPVAMAKFCCNCGMRRIAL